MLGVHNTVERTVQSFRAAFQGYLPPLTLAVGRLLVVVR
jgi:hypothetical protein